MRQGCLVQTGRPGLKTLLPQTETIMDSLKIEGGVPLKGCITVSGAKNAALPLMAAGLATSGTLQLENVPRLVDTQSMEVLLANHGMEVSRDGLNVSIGNRRCVRGQPHLSP